MATIRGSEWQRLRSKILTAAAAVDSPCWICRRPIDYDLTGRHRWAPTVDHLVPRFMGGSLLDPDNCAVAHFGCNARRGAVQRAHAVPVPSRRW
jgi:5-methylcytosine-specific restriction endonuclease McrA